MLWVSFIRSIESYKNSEFWLVYLLWTLYMHTFLLTIIREDNRQEGQMSGGHLSWRTFLPDSYFVPYRVYLDCDCDCKIYSEGFLSIKTKVKVIQILISVIDGIAFWFFIKDFSLWLLLHLELCLILVIDFLGLLAMCLEVCFQLASL